MAISAELSLDVQAKAEKIWDILVDAGSWPSWQGSTSVELSTPGPIKEGSIFIVNLDGMKWNLVVTKAERPRRLIWMGQCIGLKAIHEWEFSEEQGKTRITSKETLTGWLLLFFSPLIKKGLSDTDDKWLAALKVKSESS